MIFINAPFLGHLFFFSYAIFLENNGYKNALMILKMPLI
jgi:hypothetical protein